MGKLLNVKQIAQKVYVRVNGLSDRMLKALGKIEDTFTAIFYGGSGNGKTNFTVKILKELKSTGSMLYVSYEEGHGSTIQELINRHNLEEELPNLAFLDDTTFDELVERLKKRKSPKIIVIDSWQFSGFTYENYQTLKRLFVMGNKPGRRKIFIFISHISGKQPDGKSAIKVMRDCNIKIHIEGFMAQVISRFGSEMNYPIWEDGARRHWGANYENVLHKLPLTGKPPKQKKPATKSKKQSKEPENEEL